MRRDKTFLRPETLIVATGLVILALVAVELFWLQAAFERTIPLSLETEAVVQQQLLHDRDLLVQYGWALILLIFAMFVGLALTWVRQHRASAELNGALEAQNAELRVKDVLLEKRKAQLRESEQRLAKAQELAHIGSWRWDPHQDQLEWSEEMYRIFGVDPSKFQGTVASIVASAIHPDDRALLEAANERARQGLLTPLEYRIVHPDGTQRVVWAEGEIVRDELGNPQEMIGVVQDLTERKRAEDALRRQNEYLDALHETTISLMGRLDLNDLLQVITQRAATLVGTTHGYIYVHEPDAEEITMSVGVGIFSQMVGSTARRGVGATGTVWETGEVLVIDDYQKWQGRLDKPGTIQLRSLVSVPLKSDGQIIGVFGLAHTDADQKFDETALHVLTRFAHLASIALDNARLYAAAHQEIAERKFAEEALRRQKELLQTVFDHIPVMVGMFDRNGQYSLINHEWEQTLGYTLAEMNNGDVMTRMYPDTDHRLAARSFMFAPTPGWRDFETFVRAGGSLDTSWAYTPLSDGTTIAFGQDITKRKEVDRLKNEFISTVSHELRTPLTSIRGSLGLIAGGVAGQMPERAKNMIDIAYKNSERLVRLINDILDIEKIESGKMVFQMKPIELRPLIEQALEANRAFGEQFHVAFVIVDAAADLRINADADRMTQVLTNLLSNAAKFSPPHSKVEIRAERVGTQIRVEVRDYGGGISEEFKQSVFQKFAQADSSDTRQKGGTGLGLSIVKAIVEKHGGTINFDSTPGVGTTFYFEIPQAREALVPLRAADLFKPRILIVEDDPDVAMLLNLMLTREGYEADVAHDAARAVELLRAQRYAMLTLDLKLPDKDGIALIRELRASESTREIPIVVVSAIVEQGRRQLNGDAMWVADWLQKPIDHEHLIRAVARVAHHSQTVKPHILHVEDDPDVLQVVQSILYETANVTAALDVADARARLEREHFDLVILDLALPDGSGAELLPFLRRDDLQIPVVIFSAAQQDPMILRQVNAALVKSRTSNEHLIKTITQFIPTAGLVM